MFDALFDRTNLSKKMDPQSIRTLVYLLRVADQLNKSKAIKSAKQGQYVRIPSLDDLANKISRGDSITSDEMGLLKGQLYSVYMAYKDSDNKNLRLTSDSAVRILNQVCNL